MGGSISKIFEVYEYSSISEGICEYAFINGNMSSKTTSKRDDCETGIDISIFFDAFGNLEEAEFFNGNEQIVQIDEEDEEIIDNFCHNRFFSNFLFMKKHGRSKSH